MDCPDEDDLGAYLGRRLPPEQRAGIEAHVDACESCFAALRDLARLYESASVPAEHPDSPTSMTGSRVGRYVVERAVGRGAMGMVYAAFDPDLRRHVALKLLHAHGKANQARLLREAQAMARLSHQNVVAVHDVGKAGERVFVAMELIDGETLTRWLEPERPWRQIVNVFVRAGRGLAAAHEAGLVHSDFKPDNVLVAADGRVIVTDFGLSHALGRGQDEDTDHDEDDGDPLDARLTHSGAIVGTPAFMAPEVLAGERASPASDQFSFCVALYAGLYRQRPFDAGSLPKLEEALRGEPRDPPAATSVPARLRRTVQRGLARDGSERWPSMPELLRRLEAERKRSRTWLAVASGGAVLLGGAFGAQQLQNRREAAACHRDGAALPQWWHDTARADVQAAMLGTRASFASETWDRVAPVLDSYADDWARHRESVCVATTVDESRPASLWPGATECFDDRRRAFEALTEVWTTADREVLARAADAVRRLPSVALCEDEGYLVSRWVSDRAEPTGPTAVEAQRLLAVSDALEGAGRYGTSLTLALAGDALAGGLGHERLQAIASYRLGSILSRVDQGPAAIERLERAFALAESAGQPGLAARILVLLVHVETEHGAFGRAEVWASLAGMRSPDLDDPELAADLAQAHGNMLALSGDGPAAVSMLTAGLDAYRDTGGGGTQVGEFLIDLAGAHHDIDEPQRSRELLLEALPVYEEAFGDGHPNYAGLLSDLGVLLGDLGELDAALERLDAAASVMRDVYGPQSSQVAGLLSSRARVVGLQGRVDEAAALYERGLAIMRTALGPKHPEVVTELLNVGSAYLNARDYPKAGVRLDEALRLAREVLEPDDQMVGHILYNLGSLRFYEGKKERAIELYREALPLFEQAPVWRSQVLSNLGTMLGKLGRWDEAEGPLAESLRLRVEALPPGHPYVLNSRTMMAELHLARERPAQALTVAEAAVADAEAAKAADHELAEPRFLVARTLWETGGDKERAVALARLARDTIGEHRAGAQARIDAWLAQR